VQAEELLDDMTQKNQRMFFVTITLMVHGNTKDELEENCIILINKARKFTCQLQNLNYQQEDAFKQTLPMGLNKLYVKRTLTTESTAIFMPFSSQELYEVGGFYYGLNQISRNLILLDRTNMKTPSGFILGSSGSGKSFATKREILNVLLHDNKTRILIIDPDNEYAGFARAFGGEVINISAESTNYINPLDMSLGYSEEGTDPLATKSEYIMSIIENMLSIGSGNSAKSTITPTQKTIIDRCLKLCYKEYLDSHFDESKVPTLLELQEEFDREKEISGTEDARQIAEGVEYYTKGSMNIFSHKSNVEYSNRLVVFNIQSLGNQLKAIALLIVMEFCWNSMLKGKSEGQRVYLYVDEIHSLFQNDFSARYLQQFYKRGRKYGLVVTGITQNMEDLLRSEMAKGMIGNSDFIMMLNQAPEDLKVLANMLNISENRMTYCMAKV
jgi:type IV secretory pathway VirB4 component